MLKLECGVGAGTVRRVLCIAAVVGVLAGSGARAEAQETAAELLARTKGAHAADPTKAPDGGVLPPPEELTSAARGTIKLFTVDGLKATFPLTFVREGYSKMLTIVHQPGVDVRLGTDGESSWHSLSIGMRTEAIGPPLNFVESYTTRSPRSLFYESDRARALADKGRAGTARVLEGEEPGGRKTDYHIDDETSVVTRMEFVTGEATDVFGNTVQTTETYVFSEFREVDGVFTPFTVERLIDGVKAEEMNFEAVVLNVDLEAAGFKFEP